MTYYRPERNLISLGARKIRNGDPYEIARCEHAWLLRAEEVSYREIAARLGVTRERARTMVTLFGQKVSWALRNVSWGGFQTDWCANCWKDKPPGRFNYLDIDGDVIICDDCVERENLRHDAWLLRTEGLIYSEIGDRLGISEDRAHQLVKIFGRRNHLAIPERKKGKVTK